MPNLVTRTVLWRRLGEAHGVALCDADAARLARLVPAAPAVASTALRATRLAGGGAETARLIVEGVARAVRGGALPAPEPEADTSYDPALVNADCDLVALEADLLRPGRRALSSCCRPPGRQERLGAPPGRAHGTAGAAEARLRPARRVCRRHRAQHRRRLRRGAGHRRLPGVRRGGQSAAGTGRRGAELGDQPGQRNADLDGAAIRCRSPAPPTSPNGWTVPACAASW